MILMYASVGRRGKAQSKPFAATRWFAAGYLLAWSGFSLVATVLQWGIERAALLVRGWRSPAILTGAVVLIAAGVIMDTAQECLSRPMPVAASVLMRHGGFATTGKAACWLGLRTAAIASAAAGPDGASVRRR